jgi:succinate-semialdehyde dehydrogenase/glutarate-semialdehyde dehydrogenase
VVRCRRRCDVRGDQPGDRGRQLEYGILGINTGFISVEVAPFGGVKESGIGREGSKYGVDEWVQTRYLSLGGIAE